MILLKLEVGVRGEIVEVAGLNSVLQTENTTVGATITGSMVSALPLKFTGLLRQLMFDAEVMDWMRDALKENHQDEQRDRSHRTPGRGAAPATAAD